MARGHERENVSTGWQDEDRINRILVWGKRKRKKKEKRVGWKPCIEALGRLDLTKFGSR